MDKLKPCPFCGGEAELRKTLQGYRTSPVTITDSWTVKCKVGCCQCRTFQDEIYHKEDGEIVVASNGAEKAVSAWNRRTEEGAQK